MIVHSVYGEKIQKNLIMFFNLINENEHDLLTLATAIH